jgi:putative alpha-1,2-mannosidase
MENCLESLPKKEVQNKYIKQVLLNGEPYTKSFIRHADILRGGMLEIILAAELGKNFGKAIDDLPGRSIK